MKKISKSLVGILFAFVVTGCSWQVPKTVTIKQQAEYAIPLGGIEQSLDDVFSMKDMIANMDLSGSNMKVYDYNPNGNSDIQQIMLKMDIQDVPLDFSEYFNETSVSNMLEDMKIEQTFAVPSFDFGFDQEFDVSFIEKALTYAISFQTTIEGGDINFTDPAGQKIFDTITYDTGILNVTCPVAVTGDEVIIKYNGNEVVSGIFTNTTAELQLTDVTFYHDGMTIELVTSNYLPSAPVMAFPIDTGNKIKSATGITTSIPKQADAPIHAEIKMPDGIDGFESMVIAEGSLLAEIKLPGNWSGIDSNLDILFTGALNVSEMDSAGLTKEISLDNKAITLGDTVVDVNIAFTLTDATIDFTENPRIVVSSDLKKIDSVCFELKELENLSVNTTEDVPEDLTKYIRKIQLRNSGILIDYETDLPQGNEIGINAYSEFFNINDTSVIRNGADSISVCSSNEVDFSQTTKIDFMAKINLPGSTVEKPNRIELRNIQLGAEYGLKIKIVPQLDFDFVEINSDQLKTKDTVATGINLNDMMSSFTELFESTGMDSILDKLELPKIPFYLYIEMPEALSDFALKGSIVASYGEKLPDGTIEKNTAIEPVVLFDTAESAIASAKFPELSINDDGTVTTDLSKIAYSVTTDKISDLLTQSLSVTGEELLVDYDIYAEDKNGSDTHVITIRKEMLNMGASSISIKAVVAIPFEFMLDDKIEMDIMSMIADAMGIADSENKDLLNRSPESFGEPSEILDIALDSIKSVSCTYTSTALPFVIENDALYLRANMYGDDKPEHVEELSFAKGKINVSPELVKTIMEKPYYPSISVVIGQENKKTKFALPRSMNIGLNFDFKIATDVNISMEVEELFKSMSGSQAEGE